MSGLTVGELRELMEGLPPDTPVISPCGLENAAEQLERAYVTDGRSRTRKQGEGCGGGWGVDEKHEDGSTSGLFTKDRETCCGEPTDGPVVTVLYLA